MIRMMLKPGAGCEFTEIDQYGIWGPHQEAINLERLIRERGGVDVKWMPLYGLTNVPPVITWLIDESNEFGAQAGSGRKIFDSRWCWDRGIIESQYWGEE